MAMDVEVITNENIYQLIQGLMLKSDEIKQQNELIKEELKNELQIVRAELKGELEKIKNENQLLREENIKLKEKISQIERQTRKYNIVVYGLKEEETEVEDIQAFLNLINQHLEIEIRFEDLRDIFRFGKKAIIKSGL